MTAAAPGSAQLPRPGDMIAGKYVLDRLLGQGGMGAVFAAKHVKLSKSVAIKIMLADASNPEAAQRFINEGRAAANIQNEHVVRVDDVDEEMGYAYMVLELLDGEDLSQILDREPTHRLPSHVVVDYVLQALKGVSQAHAIGIVHRDLKPSNLFLARRKDGSSVVKVLDFGISKAQGSSALAASPSALTSTKAMLGSPLYMSPEQLRSSKSVDQRADIWAIGVILYELITGTLPFMGENLGELFAAILETDPAPLRSRAENVPPGLDEVVLRCLQRKPDHRFQTATELANALAPFAQPGFRAPTGSVPAFGGTAMLAPGTAASAMMSAMGAITPGPQSAMPVSSLGMPSSPGPMSGSSPGAITGPGATSGRLLSNSDPRLAAGVGGTTGGWQSTGGANPAVPKKPVVAIAIAAAAAFVLVVGVIIAVVATGGKKGAGEPTAASAPPPPVSVVSATPPASITAPVVSPPPVETAAASASASTAAVAAHVSSSPTPKNSKSGTGKADSPKVDPPKAVDPPPAKTSKAGAPKVEETR